MVEPTCSCHTQDEPTLFKITQTMAGMEEMSVILNPKIEIVGETVQQAALRCIQFKGCAKRFRRHDFRPESCRSLSPASSNENEAGRLDHCNTYHRLEIYCGKEDWTILDLGGGGKRFNVLCTNSNIT